MLCCAVDCELGAELRREKGYEAVLVSEGSHNAERHLANKGRNNNSMEGFETERLSLRRRHTGAQRDATTKRRGLALSNTKKKKKNFASCVS